VTRPLLEPFRRIIPSLGGIDVSPIVVLLLLEFARRVFNALAAPSLMMLG
jgi:YggT family protein